MSVFEVIGIAAVAIVLVYMFGWIGAIFALIAGLLVIAIFRVLR